jgi:hypothetical protein
MSIKDKVFSRAGNLIAATLVALGALVPAVVPMVSADQQVQTRSIEMSDATVSKSGVDYVVTFTPTTTDADSLVIDFCNNSSIIGGTCTVDGTSIITTGATYTAGTGMPAGWVRDTTATGHVSTNVMLKDNSGTGANKLGTSAITFTISGITNPTFTGTFWARVYTYADDSFGSTTTAYASAASIGDDLDYGGFALSTIDLINISATVMETLTFCINKTTIGAACSGLTPGVALTLGTGSPTKVLSTTTGVGSEDNAFLQVSTNALTGVVVKMKSHNTCAGLSRNGGTDGCPIAAIGVTPNNLTAANQALFGVNAAADTPLGSTIGTFTPDAPYNTADYAMDTTSGNDPTAGGGTKLAHTPSAAADLGGVLTFNAEAAATTPAGVYTADESLIATGTF